MGIHPKIFEQALIEFLKSEFVIVKDGLI